MRTRDVHVCMRARSCLCDACSRVEQVYAPRFFFLLLIPAVLSSRLFLWVCLSPCRKGDARGDTVGRQGPAGHFHANK